MINILIIESELKVASFIKRGLEESAYAVEVAFDGKAGIHKAVTGPYNLVIMDLNHATIDAYELCRLIRKDRFIPILMLTSSDDFQSRLGRSEACADDYLQKPFEFKELLVRIRALTSRNKVT